MRLIDADIAINILNESIAINRTDVAMGLRLAMYEIDMLPTIDAVPVVRCKDCQEWEHRLVDEDGDFYCLVVDHYISGEWYCADGESKDEGGE